MPHDATGPAGISTLLDPLGFPIDDGSMPAAAAAAAPRLQRRPSYTSAYATLIAAATAAVAIDDEAIDGHGGSSDGHVNSGGGKDGNGGDGNNCGADRSSAGTAPALSSLQAAAHGRLSVGNWWAHDALHLCRWNALICSCASLDDVPSSRLRYLLAGGVPLQHRMHVWESCAGASSLRGVYGRYQQADPAEGTALEGAAVGGAVEEGAIATDDDHGDDGASGKRSSSVARLVDSDAEASRPTAQVTAAAPADDPTFRASARVIEKDLLRTLPTHPFLNRAAAPLIAPLRRVLLTFARHVPDVSYCQGLNFVAAVLLLHADEARAFAMLCTLCESVLPEYHTPAMQGLMSAQDTLLALVAHAAPRAHARLAAEGVPLREQTTAWLLCAFVEALPLEAALRVWDLLFFDGQVALLRAAAAAFVLAEPVLLASAECVFDLREVLEGCDAGELVQASLEPSLCAAAEGKPTAHATT